MKAIKTNKKYYTHYSGSGLVCTFISFGLSLASFVTPYWLQSWSRVHTPFDRLGLWEFCLDGFIFRTDASMKSYFGCWWIFAPEYWTLADFLMPWWFRLVQFGMSITVILHLVCLVVFSIYLCRCIKHPQRRAIVTQFLFIVMFLTGCLVFCVSIIFGARSIDRYWMPNPELNWPSWSYGLAILSGFFSYFSAGLIWVQMKFDRKRLAKATYAFPMSSKSSDKLNTSQSTII